jgi:hypothetical protein
MAYEYSPPPGRDQRMSPPRLLPIHPLKNKGKHIAKSSSRDSQGKIVSSQRGSPASIPVIVARKLKRLLRWLSSDCNVADGVSPSTVRKGEGTFSRVLRAIGVQILVLGCSKSIAAKCIRLFWIHAQNFGKRKQSWNNQPPHLDLLSPVYPPYEWKPCSAIRSIMTPSFLRAL